MELIRNFTQLNKGDSALAGGKGASLGEMTQAGINVPPGFVVLSESFEQFLRETDLIQEIDSILHGVKHEQIHTVDAASESIRALILSREMPKDIASEIERSFKELNTKYVAVRSSATVEDGTDHAWAGQLESYLNTKEDDVLTKVKLCWSSLFTPRAIFYRFEKGLHTTKISVAVVVQKMVESEVSGIAFSVHPVTEDRNQLIIEAGFGLGEAIVSGSVTPDSYVVEKDIKKIIDINVSTQERGLFRSENISAEHGNNEWREIAEPRASSQVLTEAQILELSEMIIGIENHYGFPCDIEWAYEAGKFYIVQSRPITTLAAVNIDTAPVSKSDFSKFSSVAQKRTWRKDWEGTFSILLSNMSTTPYFVNFKEEFGVNIDNTITTHKNGLASCFISIEDEKVFGDEMAKRVIANPTLLDVWSNRTKTEYDEVFKIIPLEIEEILKKENINTLVKHVQIFTAYLGAIKYVSNFLDKDLVAAHGQSMIEARLYTEKIFPSLETLTNNISEYIGKKEGYNPELIPALITSELISYVENGKLPEQNVLEARKKMSGYLYKDTVSEIIGSDVVEIENLVYGHHTDTLFGTGVFPGKVTGRVKIILEFGKEHSKFEEGDVLVSGMTDPNFVPLMKKAKAIITDGGGMLCHAAIVSRELGVPCIIGTGKATRILKDGDMVEVDADNGTVRILENTSNDPAKVGGKDWKLVVTRNMSHWHNLLSLRGHAFNTKDFGIDVPCLWLCVTIDSTKTSVFMEPENSAVYSKAVMDAFSTKEKVNAIKGKYQEIVANAMKAFEAADTDLNLETWKKFLDAYQRLTPGLMITTNFGRGGTEKIIELLKKKGIEENEIHQIIAAVTYPVEHTPMFDSQIALMEIGMKAQNGELDKNGIETELTLWINEYGCIPVNFCEEPWSMQDAALQLQSLMKKDCKAELAKAIEDHERRGVEQKSILEKLNDPELEIVAYALAEATNMNEFRKNAFCRLSLGYRGMFTKIAELGGSKRWRDIFYLAPEETTALLAGENIDIAKLVSERRVAGAYVNDKGETVLLDQNTLNGLESLILATYTGSGASIDKTDFVKGFSANKGKVRGVARVILSSKDFGRLNPNEVLVTTMTSVDFVPVMERAIAFVTNEGGITSHAAIVAREMNKPCVIGTKNATQVIKDGDMVEVDANNGIVRIIS